MKLVLIIRFILTTLLYATLAQSAPLAELKFCGKELTDTLAEVCSGRGYNAFWPDYPRGNERRPKRGVVDECCRRFCTWSTLESYCSPTYVTSTTQPDNISVRKRNNLENVLKSDGNLAIADTSRLVYKLPPETKGVSLTSRHHQRKLFAHTDSDINWPTNSNQRFGPTYKHNLNKMFQSSYLNSKVKRNGAPSDVLLKEKHLNCVEKDLSYKKKALLGADDELLSQLHDSYSGRERIRHPRTHSSKIIKLKDSSQVGTIAPYFLGRTLVLSTSRKTRQRSH